jgi:hypothetical protein
MVYTVPGFDQTRETKESTCAMCFTFFEQTRENPDIGVIHSSLKHKKVREDFVPPGRKTIAALQL